MDGYSTGYPDTSATGSVLRDHRRVVLVAFSSFLGHKSILFAALMTMLKGLDLIVQLRFTVVEVESDSANVVSWATSYHLVQWEFVYLLN